MEIKDDMVVIKASDIVEALPLEQKQALIRQCALECDVIRDVVDQLVDGMTEDCSGGLESTLHTQRMRLLAHMPEVAVRVVQRLQNELNTANRDLAEMRRWESDVRAAIPGSWHIQKPYARPEYCDLEQARELAGVPAPAEEE